jgi:hypothetical protein
MLYGTFAPVITEPREVPSKPMVFLGVYPNPLRSTAKMRFELPDADFVTVSIVDILGQQVTRSSQKWMTAGRQEVEVDLADRSSGVYWVRLETSRESIASSVVVVR